uniref:Uncharacterized protein n=1 Tax=Panagrolaimus sp. JU765 TaxID=591449 RepID=A0AC34QDE7_9BILA
MFPAHLETANKAPILIAVPDNDKSAKIPHVTLLREASIYRIDEHISRKKSSKLIFWLDICLIVSILGYCIISYCNDVIWKQISEKLSGLKFHYIISASLLLPFVLFIPLFLCFNCFQSDRNNYISNLILHGAILFIATCYLVPLLIAKWTWVNKDITDSNKPLVYAFVAVNLTCLATIIGLSLLIIVKTVIQNANKEDAILDQVYCGIKQQDAFQIAK